MNYKMQDLCEITSSRRIFAREYKNFGIPFYRSQEVIECSLKGNTNPTIFISEERYNEIIKSGLGIPCLGDILMSAIGANRGYPWCVNKVPFYFKDGNVIWLRNFKPFCNSKYLTYFLSTSKCIDTIQKSSEHSAQGAITLDLIKKIQIDLPSIGKQQHIVNTIGSVDDLIENLMQQNEILMNLGITKINLFNDSNELKLLSTIVEFEKGFEVGSSNYIENDGVNLIQYLRVGDLLSLGNTFIDESISNKISKIDDILVAFDGAPGRNNIGLYGAYSSGIYNLKCNYSNKGLVYFEINSDINKKIIDDHSQGTTILHASKSINHLVYANIDDKDKELLNAYFNLLLQNKKKINSLKHIKANLLNKYF